MQYNDDVFLSSFSTGGSNVGVNPKINNMNPGYEAAKYEIIMISDSGIRSTYLFVIRKNKNVSSKWKLHLQFIVKEDTLLDMIGYMTNKVGLVHQMPFTCDREGFAATFEKVIIHFDVHMITYKTNK